MMNAIMTGCSAVTMVTKKVIQEEKKTENRLRLQKPIFPYFEQILEVTDPDVIELIQPNVQYAGAFLKKTESKDEVVSNLDDIYNVGTFVQVKDIIKQGDHLKITIQGIRRIQIIRNEQLFPEEVIQSQKILMVHTKNLIHEPSESTVDVKTNTLELIQIIMGFDSEFLAQIMNEELKMFDGPAYIADFGAAALTNADPHQLQKVLECIEVSKRLRLSLELLKGPTVTTKLEKTVEQVEEEGTSKYVLQECLKILMRRLGMEKDDNKDAVAEKFREKIQNLVLPSRVQTVIDKELRKLSCLDQNAPEFSVTHNYLDWLTSMPWGKTSDAKITDTKHAQQVLDKDHYGLQEFKKRILEFIAVSQLKKSVQGASLCFVGPPGVGKTSITHSIAKVLNREHFTISVGGVTDVAEIKGPWYAHHHGFMPGKLMQCLKETQIENPLVLIDEVDKIGSNIRGDLASTLLEVVDRKQNFKFLDCYLDIPVDLSKVLFICTANMVHTIPESLQHCLEIIEVSDYAPEEKKNIAEKHIVPVVRLNVGLTDNQVMLEPEAIEELIKWYCRESGVRDLERNIEKIFRKVALRIVENPDCQSIYVSSDMLKDFVGNPKFTSDRMYETTPPGVVMGLARIGEGGCILYIESCLAKPVSDNAKDSGSIRVTGQLGDVMKESADIAHTFAKSFLAKQEPENNKFLQQASIHIHLPQGAIFKDGPSTGCAMVSALLSLAMDKPVKHELAMTGEISLTGKVLPVGGIKEKTIAAKRSNVMCIILPESNRVDYEDLSDSIKKGLKVYFVKHYSELFQLIFE